jgi:hypothetical protein
MSMINSEWYTGEFDQQIEPQSSWGSIKAYTCTDYYQAPKDKDDPDPQAIEVYIKRVQEEALKIDPATAEIDRWRVPAALNSYGFYPEPLDENQSFKDQTAGPFEKQIDISTRLTWFARSPGSDLWIEFDNLPEAVRSALEAQINAGRKPPDLPLW